MISEVLLGLSGIEGDFVILKNEKFFLNPTIKTIGESEKQMINSILNLGSIYRKINLFIEDEKMNENFFLKKSIQSSINEIIENYDLNLIKIEKKLIKNHFTPFVFLKHSLFDVNQLNSFNNIIFQVRNFISFY